MANFVDPDDVPALGASTGPTFGAFVDPDDTPAPATMTFKRMKVPKPIQSAFSPDEPGVDYKSGIPNATLRAMLSLANTDEEKLDVLERMTGQGQVGIDRKGRFYVRPEGLKRLGVQSQTPRAVDEYGITRYDLADIAGDVPAIAGGIAGGYLGGGLPLFGSVVTSALGGAAGSTLKEGTRQATGVGPFMPGQVGQEALMAGVGEGVTRGVARVGRTLLGPGASRMTPERAAVMESALQRGYRPLPDEVRGGGLLSRVTGVARQMYGHPGESFNINAALSELRDLTMRAGQPVAKEQIGTESVAALRQAREVFGTQASNLYREVDAILGGQPVVPVTALKRQADDILNSLARTEGGQPAFADPGTVGFLQRISQLPNSLTVGQMQQVRTELRNAAFDSTLTPGLEKRHARQLFRAADQTFDDVSKVTGFTRQSSILGPDGKPITITTPVDPVVNMQAVAKLRAADKFYKDGIRQFDDAVLNRLTKDAGQNGAVDPDQFLEFVIRPKHANRAQRIMAMLPPQQIRNIRGTFSEDLLQPLMQDATNPFEKILRGDLLKQQLDRYGPETLDVVMGEPWRRAAYDLANTVKLVTAGNKSAGGLVVAHTMLQAFTQPTNALPKMGAYKLLHSALQNPNFIRYMTTGIRAPTAEKAGLAINRALVQLGMQTGEVEGGELDIINTMNLGRPE